MDSYFKGKLGAQFIKVSISLTFVILLSDSIYHPMSFCEKKFDLDKMQSILEVSMTFKFVAVLVRHSHQSSLGLL